MCKGTKNVQENKKCAKGTKNVPISQNEGRKGHMAHRSRMQPSRSESPKYNFVNHGKIVKTLNFL